jgi:hypothetical protein
MTTPGTWAGWFSGAIAAATVAIAKMASQAADRRPGQQACRHGTCKIIGSKECMMRRSYRVAGRRLVAAIGAAGFVAVMMLAGETSAAFASAPLASAGVTNSWSPAPGPEIIRTALTPADTPVDQPPAPAPQAIVIIDRPGDPPGPK